MTFPTDLDDKMSRPANIAPARSTIWSDSGWSFILSDNSQLILFFGVHYETNNCFLFWNTALQDNPVSLINLIHFVDQFFRPWATEVVPSLHKEHFDKWPCETFRVSIYEDRLYGNFSPRSSWWDANQLYDTHFLRPTAKPEYPSGPKSGHSFIHHSIALKLILKISER